MRINTPRVAQHHANSAPKRQSSALYFGLGNALPPHTNSTSTNSSLSGRDTGVLFYAILLSIPTVMFGAYKFSQFCANYFQNRRLLQAHNRMLADAEDSYPAEQNAFRMMNPIPHPNNAVTRAERVV